jgi:hypothetical protein
MTLYKLNPSVVLIGEHSYLDTADECYFTGEYYGSEFPGMKPVILSLKRGQKSVILSLARQLAMALPREWVSAYTFVPMPASTKLASPLRSLVARLEVSDTRDLLIQDVDTPASHNGWRPVPSERARLWKLDELEATPEPKTVIVVDDVLATGAHFRAAKMIIRQKWPLMRVIGLFLARVARPKISSGPIEVFNSRTPAFTVQGTRDSLR